MEHGSSLRRLGGVLAVALVAALAGVCFHAQPAHADTLLDAKRARYAHVRTEIRHLDNHAEMLTEQYDKVVWQLGVLRKRMKIATHRLIVERAKLRYEQGVLGRLIVEQYKGGDPRTIEIVLEASSLSQVTGGMDLKQRLDTAVADTVRAINAAKLAIAAERRAIAVAQVRERADKRQIIIRRREIRRELRKRHRLVGDPRPPDHRHDGRRPHRPGRPRPRGAEVAHRRPARRRRRPRPGAARPDRAGGAAADRRAVRLGRRDAERLRLLRPRHVAVGEARRRAAALRGLAVPHGPARSRRPQLRPGDLVFFHDLGHVAIYIGNGWVVHAPHTGDWVRMERFSLGWFQATYVGATQPGPA